MAHILKWLILHYDEILGTIISFVYLYFSIKQSIWLWPLGLFSSAIYVYVFFKAGIYADMGLQIYYVVVSIFGWYNWKKIQGRDIKPVPPKSVVAAPIIILLLLVATIIIFIILTQLLIHFTNSKIPYMDAFITSLSIVGTWMLAKKYLENWLVWIVVDAVSVGVYYYKGLQVTIVLYIVYTILAIVGYKAWIDNKNQNIDVT